VARRIPSRRPSRRSSIPGRLAVEGRIDQATRDGLAARGHEIRDWPDWTWLAGSVERFLTDPATA